MRKVLSAALKPVLAFTLALFVGASLPRVTGLFKDTASLDPYSEEEYAKRTKMITDTLSLNLVAELEPGWNPNGVVVVALRARDITRCEDLGRQIRELRRETPEAASFEVWTDSRDSSTVLDFLKIERIAYTRLRDIEVRRLFDTKATVQSTPLALVLDKHQDVLAGVSHPGRFANARPRSFASELAKGLNLLILANAAPKIPSH